MRNPLIQVIIALHKALKGSLHKDNKDNKELNLSDRQIKILLELGKLWKSRW